MFGRQTLDDGSGLTAAQTARVLGWPMLGFVGHITLDGSNVQVARVIEEGRQNVKAPLPVVMTIVQSIGEPRYPSFIGIRKAAKATIPVWSLADMGTPAPTAVVTRTELVTPPTREVICEIISGESPKAIAETLADKILAEKVL
jgi:electron transfer flavoprotein beta subunit